MIYAYNCFWITKQAANQLKSILFKLIYDKMERCLWWKFLKELFLVWFVSECWRACSHARTTNLPHPRVQIRRAPPMVRQPPGRESRRLYRATARVPMEAPCPTQRITRDLLRLRLTVKQPEASLQIRKPRPRSACPRRRLRPEEPLPHPQRERFRAIPASGWLPPTCPETQYT